MTPQNSCRDGERVRRKNMEARMVAIYAPLKVVGSPCLATDWNGQNARRDGVGSPRRTRPLTGHRT